MKRETLTLALVGLLHACGGTQSDTAHGAESPSEQWKAELIQADEAFAEAIGQEGLSRWGSFFASEGAVIQQGTGEIRGVEAIQANMDAAASGGSLTSFTWAPERAEVSTGGDLGYTVGRYRTTVVGPDGVEMVNTGMYVSIWRRQADGSWKVEMDLGNPVTGPDPLNPDEGGGEEEEH